MQTLTRERTVVLPSRSGLAIATVPKMGMDELLDLMSVGMMAPIEGADRGTNTEGDVITQTVDGRSLNDIWTEFQETMRLHNERRQRLVDLLTFSVTQPVEDVPQISGDDFEEASEFGEPKGIRGGAYFSLGYDFKWYDLAIRYTWMYLAEATAAQVESLNNMAIEADNRLVFSRVMRSIFNNVNREAEIRGQAINVYPFYNGDGTVPPTYKNYVHAGTHSHYITSGAALVDSGDLDDMETHLVHHGYGKQAGAQLIMLANRVQLATIRGFRVANGDSYDFIPAQGQAPFLLPVNTGGIQGGQPPSTFQGLPVAGVYGPWLILEEDYVPAGYLVGFATGGERQATNPVGLREHQNTGLRGLRLVKGRDADYPLIDSFYNRGFGTGIRHRGAGIVMQITANANYAIPADYL
jgi:hypothetical protein